MSLRPDVQDIIKDLHEKGIMDCANMAIHQLNGTTDGLVYTLSVNNESKYVLKLDHPEHMILVEQFHRAYQHSALIPKLLYTDPVKSFIVYSYISGTTHYHRGSKISWLTRLIQELFNHYENYQPADKWGGQESPRQSWREFIERNVEGARKNIGNFLPIEDYDKVRLLIKNTSGDEERTDKFLLHGDAGVHNFVFDENTLTGVIDPSPMVGPVLYDFTYAFCSSPDDLNLETLNAAFTLLNHAPMERSRLIEKVAIQLYCRIGLCCIHHPHDLADYLQAWDYWKGLVQ